MDNRKDLLVVDWYKDDQAKALVQAVVETLLNENLPESFDAAIIQIKNRFDYESFC